MQWYGMYILFSIRRESEKREKEGTVGNKRKKWGKVKKVNSGV